MRVFSAWPLKQQQLIVRACLLVSPSSLAGKEPFGLDGQQKHHARQRIPFRRGGSAPEAWPTQGVRYKQMGRTNSLWRRPIPVPRGRGARSRRGGRQGSAWRGGRGLALPCWRPVPSPEAGSPAAPPAPCRRAPEPGLGARFPAAKGAAGPASQAAWPSGVAPPRVSVVPGPGTACRGSAPSLRP